jgi:hypothetical protein
MVFYMQESDPSALAMLRWKFVVQKYTHPPHRISLPFPNPGIRMDRRRAALLLILIWSYSLAVTCPPLFGWGHTSHHDLVAAHIRFVEYKSKLMHLYSFSNKKATKVTRDRVWFLFVHV